MTTPKRRPACPDCGEPGKNIRGNHFLCHVCSAVWEEVAWEKRMINEKTQLEESERLCYVSGIIAITDIKCDVCGKIIEPGNKYCYDTYELIDNPNDTSFPTKRGKRLCKKCSLRAGFLRMVRNRKTGEVNAVMLIGREEEPID